MTHGKRWRSDLADACSGSTNSASSYFSTGNAAPDFNGSARKGDNLFTASMLALDVKTGATAGISSRCTRHLGLRLTEPRELFDAPFYGTMRKGIARCRRPDGSTSSIARRAAAARHRGASRAAGTRSTRRRHSRMYWGGFRVVPQEIDIAPEGFDLINHGRIFTPFWDKVVLYKPQMAVNWPPSSYDPQSHHMFICGIDHVASSVSDLKQFTLPTFQSMYMGGGGANPGVARRGTFTAMDLVTNRIVWQQQWPSSCFNGSLATKGGLIFVGRSDGRFTALDSSNGQSLWQFQTDAGVAASASTFEHQGRQFVVVLSAGTMFGGGKKGDSVWLFSLDGTINPLSTPTRAWHRRRRRGATGGPGDLARQTVYSMFCSPAMVTKVGGHGVAVTRERLARRAAAANTPGSQERDAALPRDATPEQLATSRIHLEGAFAAAMSLVQRATDAASRDSRRGCLAAVSACVTCSSRLMISTQASRPAPSAPRREVRAARDGPRAPSATARRILPRADAAVHQHFAGHPRHRPPRATGIVEVVASSWRPPWFDTTQRVGAEPTTCARLGIHDALQR